MPAISHLNGSGRSLASGLRIDTAAIAAHDLHAGMLPQPFRYARRLSIRKQVDHPVLLQITENRAIAMTLLPCPIIDTKHARRYYRRHSSLMMKLTQQSRSAGQQPQPACQPCSGSAT